MYHQDIEAYGIESAQRVVLDELNKKKFISLSKGKLIPTDAILEVQIVEAPKPFDPVKYHDTIYPNKTPM